MTKLHELLAVEKTRTSAATKILQETVQKFSKSEMFSGQVKSLTMIEDSPTNKVLEAALPTVCVVTRTESNKGLSTRRGCLFVAVLDTFLHRFFVNYSVRFRDQITP